MGVDIHAFIEFDDSLIAGTVAEDQVAMEPFSQPTGGVIPLDEYVELIGAKDYNFIGAISGVRAPRGEPLFPLRGLPPHLSPQIYHEINALYDPETGPVGWLSLQEVDQALNHMDIPYDDLSLEAQVVLRMMRFLESKLGAGRVRLVFGVE